MSLLCCSSNFTKKNVLSNQNSLHKIIIKYALQYDMIMSRSTKDKKMAIVIGDRMKIG